MLGIGRVHTSSPTSSMTGCPASFQASTADPSCRHCISPAICGNSRLPVQKLPKRSVPPEMLYHQMFAVPMASNCRVPHLCTSSARGEPVLPRARMRERSPQSAICSPAFLQFAKKAAPAPKNVTLCRAAKRHSTLQSGLSFAPLGLPSKRQRVVPDNNPETCTFHMTQPVDEYQ